MKLKSIRVADKENELEANAFILAIRYNKIDVAVEAIRREKLGRKSYLHV